MRHPSLRLALIAGVALAALPAAAAAQDAPVNPPVPVPAPEAPAVAPAPETPPAAEVAPPIPEVWAPAPVDAQGRSAYGLYLSGRLANLRGQRETAAILLTETEALTPEQPGVRDETFMTALLSGDLGVAARLAPQGPDASPVLSDVGRLADVVQTWAVGDPRAAWALLSPRPLAEPHGQAGAYLTPWLAAAVDDWDTALRPVEGLATDPTVLFQRKEHAQLLETRRRFDEADAEYQALIASPVGVAFRVPYGQFLERRGRKAEALAQYEAALSARTPDIGAAAEKARLQAGGRAPALPDLREGAAEGLTVAAFQAGAAGGGGRDLAAIYLRMAETLHPDDETLFQLARTLAEIPLESAAREAWARIGSSDPEILARARANIGSSFVREGKMEEGLAAFRQAAALRPEDPPIVFAYANQLLQMKQYEEALAVLNGPTLNNPRQPFEVRLIRGSALQSLKRYDEAEAELWAALQLRPNDPGALNALGYMWVDSGRRVEQGAEMLARAHAAAPNDGNIQDSLGWAQYRQGQYDTAVATLEEAVAKLPANPEIVDHLGDAYWQVGRRREAGWQWTRVLTLEPDADRRAGVEKKLAEGLGTPVPAAS